MTHAKLLFICIRQPLTYTITLCVGTNLEYILNVPIAPLDGLLTRLDPIVAYLLSGGEIHTRDQWFESWSNALKISGVVCAVTKPQYTSGLPCCISTKNASRLLICNTPPTSWIRADVGPKRVLCHWVETLSPPLIRDIFYTQCRLLSAPHCQEPYMGRHRNCHRDLTLAYWSDQLSSR